MMKLKLLQRAEVMGMERPRRDAENGQCLALVGLWSRPRVVLLVVVASRLSSQGRPTRGAAGDDLTAVCGVV